MDHIRYVDQLEAHMDAGGKTAPNNILDLIAVVRSLDAEVIKLRAELAAERSDHEAALKSFDEHMREVLGHGY